MHTPVFTLTSVVVHSSLGNWTMLNRDRSPDNDRQFKKQEKSSICDHTLLPWRCLVIIICSKTEGSDSQNQERCYNLHDVSERVSRSELRMSRYEDIARTLTQPARWNRRGGHLGPWSQRHQEQHFLGYTPHQRTGNNNPVWVSKTLPCEI